MANVVEIVVTGSNNSRPTFAAIRNEGEDLNRMFATMSSRARSAFEAVSAGAKRAEDKVDDLGDQARNTGSDMDVMGKVGTTAMNALKAGAAAAIVLIGAGLVAAVAKVKTFISESKDAATNLGESFNAVNKIFQTQAGIINDWGKKNANAFGLSQRAFNEMAVPLGAMLKNNGMALDQVAQMTIKLTERAADMASVFNTDVTDALMAIQAGLRGESDPLERYGVALNEAKVQAEALAMTGKKSAEKLTDQEKAAARLALIFKQTADTAGDFRDTSEGLANGQRILAARSEEVRAKVGDFLMPVFLKWNEIKLQLVETAEKKLVPALQNMAKWIQDIAERVAPTFNKAVNEIRRILEDYKEEIEFVKEQMKDFIPLFAVVLIGAIRLAVIAFEGFIRILTVLALAWREAKEGLRNFLNVWFEMVEEFLEGSIRAFGWIPGLGPKLKQARKDFEEFRNAVNNALAGIKDKEVNVVVRYRETTGRGLPGGPAAPGFQHGGVAHGLIMAGERGIERIRVPAGSVVESAEDTARKMANHAPGGSGGQLEVRLRWEPTGDRLIDTIMESIRVEVRNFGGDVQVALT